MIVVNKIGIIHSNIIVLTSGCSATNKFCDKTGQCLSVDSLDRECCESDEVFCVRTGQCQVMADFANICGKNTELSLIVVL